MRPKISQNRWNDSNLKERDPVLKQHNHLTGKAVETFTRCRLGKGDEFDEEGIALMECHDDLMAGDSNGGK